MSKQTKFAILLKPHSFRRMLMDMAKGYIVERPIDDAAFIFARDRKTLGNEGRMCNNRPD